MNKEKTAIKIINEGNIEELDLFLNSLYQNEKLNLVNICLENAILRGDFNQINLLLNNGANINYISKNNSNNLLHFACQKDNLKIIDFLLLKGLDINSTNINGNTPLLFAVDRNQKEVVQFLCKRGANVNLKNKEGSTPLIIATQNGFLSIVKILISFNADINEKDNRFFNALTYAIGKPDILEFFFLHGANAEYKDHEGNSLIHYAIINGDIQSIQIIINQNINLESNGNGLTPLLFATKMNKIEIMKILLSNGANVNAKTKEGYYPLLFAIERSNLNSIKLLVQYDGNIEIKTNQGITPLFAAIARCNIDIVKYLLTIGASTQSQTMKRNCFGSIECQSIDPLQFAFINSNLTICSYLYSSGLINCRYSKLIFYAFANSIGYSELLTKYLIKQSVNLEETDVNGYTILYIVCSEGKLNLVELLIKEGAYVNFKHKINYQTPLHAASMKGHLKIVKTLFENGAFVNCRSKHNETPLFYAAWNNHIEIVEYLISVGANIDLVNNLSYSPLMACIENGYDTLIKTFVESNADLNIRTKNGYTCLFLACASKSYNKLNIIKYLIKKGALSLINIGDNKKRTPLHFASSRGLLSIVKYLISLGANLMSSDKYGITPLHFAAQNGHNEVVKYLLSCGVNPNSSENNGVKPIHLAAATNHSDIIQSLINFDCNLNSTDHFHFSTFQHSAFTINFDLMQYLFSTPMNSFITNFYCQDFYSILEEKTKKKLKYY